MSPTSVCYFKQSSILTFLKHVRVTWPGTHIKSRRLEQRAQGLHESAPDGVLELKGEVGTRPLL